MAGLTAAEMQYEAKVIYEAIASADAPGYTPRQWSILLTQAQENIVLETLHVGFDFDEIRRRILHTLIEEEEFGESDIDYAEDNRYSVTLNEDYLHIVRDVANTNIKVRPVSHDFYYANINNPFERPNEEEYWRLIGKNTMTIVTSGVDLTQYNIVYLRRPLPIITIELPGGSEIEGNSGPQNCELDHSVHRQVVNEAAKLAHSYTNNQLGYQLQSMENNRSRFGPQVQG